MEKPRFETCAIEGCGKPVRYPTEPHCNMHYTRKWRYNTFDLKKAKTTIIHSRGYVLDRVPDHPLATPGSKYVYRHRRVYFDAYGWGPFPCHVCNARVTWDTMHIDHLDDDPLNNDVSNLAPACPVCNQARGRDKAIATKKASGRSLTFQGETLCLSDWARRLGITRASLSARLTSGWSLERALSEGRGKYGPQRTTS